MGVLDFSLPARAAHMGEHVYERHEDVMSDAAGDVANRGEPGEGSEESLFFFLVFGFCSGFS